MKSRGREARGDKNGKLAMPFSSRLVICLHSQEVLVCYEMTGVKARLQRIEG